MPGTEYAEVVVVGAGPVGLLLACELSLAGIRPLVLERLEEPDGGPKARGIGVLAHEALRRRGFGPDLDRAHEQGTAALARDHGTTRTHFAWIHKIDPELADPGRRGALIAQPELAGVLRRRAAELGVEVRYSATVTGLGAGGGRDADGGLGTGGLGADGGPGTDGGPVELSYATPAGERRVAAGFVVGCDGGHSTVRALAGFAFPGTEPLMTVRYARAEVLGRERLPQPGRLPAGTLFHEPEVIATFDFAQADYDRTAPLTADEMRASVRRVAGVDIEFGEFHGGLRFTDRAAQAETYQRGRVLLAGDAAHIHSPNGGQGLNLGLMDAMNLGWKLAAAACGTAGPDLLAGYTTERHPVAAAVLHNTRAQSALLSPGPHVDALREIMSDLMDLPAVNRHLSRLLSGIEHRYTMPYPAAHPLTGAHCPPLLADGKPLEDLMNDGRPLLLGPFGTEPAADDAERVTVLEVGSFDRDDLTAVLIRPDGVVAWAAGPATGATGTIDDETSPKADPALRQALDAWCPSPR